MAQDAEVGDGTTSVVLLAGELLVQAKSYVEENMSPQILIKAYRQAADLAIQKVKEVCHCSEARRPGAIPHFVGRMRRNSHELQDYSFS